MSIVNSYRESGLIYRLGERIIGIDPHHLLILGHKNVLTAFSGSGSSPFSRPLCYWPRAAVGTVKSDRFPRKRVEVRLKTANNISQSAFSERPLFFSH
jgi:hypothetical protein